MKGSYVTIITKTWDKDSHGLYDYDLPVKKEYKINGFKSFVVARKKNGNCIFATSSSVNGWPLLSIINIANNSSNTSTKGGQYYVDNWFQKRSQTCFDDLRNSNWIPIRYGSEDLPIRNGYKLELGDVVKFGRLIFQVKKICTGKIENKPKFRSISNKIHSFDASVDSLGGFKNKQENEDLNLKMLNLK